MTAPLTHRLKHHSPRVAALSIVLALALLPISTPALAAQPHVPFKGTIQAQETGTLNFPILSVQATGSGTATQLGLYSVTYQVSVNLLTLFGIESYQFVAANGDSLFAEGTGQGTPTDTPNVDVIVEHVTITGGTGRFAGATGSFAVVRLLNVVTEVSAGAFDGDIVRAH